MKKSEIILLILTLLSTLAFAQSNYKDYSENDRDNLFYENFQSYTNRNNIMASNDGVSFGEYHYGYFELKSTSSGYLGATADLKKEIDQKRDFEIEASIMFVSGEANNRNAITWGKKDNNNQYLFGFTGNGNFTIYKIDNGSLINFKDWTISSILNKKDYNKLTIRKVNSTYYFFINEALVHSCPFEDFFGNYFQVIANSNSLIKINSIRISYLNKNNNSSVNDFHDNLPPILSIKDITFSKNHIDLVDFIYDRKLGLQLIDTFYHDQFGVNQAKQHSYQSL